jgi:hypothetical protein
VILRALVAAAVLVTASAAGAQQTETISFESR